LAPVVDPKKALRQHLEHAAACYGDDLPLPVRTRPPAVAPAVPPDVPRDVTSEVTPAVAPDAVSNLEQLQHQALACQQCKLCQTRTTVVFGEGNANARVMFVGEAPGQREDETGRPFVGRAGQLLDKIIENAMGMRRQDVYIGNINKCRPPGNRDPEPDEVAACLPFIRGQVRLVQPEVIVTLGRVAAWNLLGTRDAMKNLRGRTLLYEGTPVVPTWHPAYLLRNPAAKAGCWDDIKRVNRLLGHPEVPQNSQS
jgi:DNA polymerase